jgi:hypothetical protein
MLKDTSKIFLDGKSVEFLTASINIRGSNTAGELNFVMTSAEPNYRNLWNKEVTVYFQTGDAYPIFRGRVVDTTVESNYALKVKCLDVYGFLTGHQRARVLLDESKNIDGLSAGASIHKLIGYANLENVIGTDYVGDTSPIIQNLNPRGIVVIQDEIRSYMTRSVNLSNEDLPRQNLIVVRDDGNKAQLQIETRADVDNVNPIHYYSYDKNIINFQARNRHIPTTVVVRGDDVMGEFRHKSAAQAYGEYFMEVTNKELDTQADCVNFAQKIFRANLKTKYEYTLNTFEGVYLNENDVVYIKDNDTGIEGNFRVIGKVITFSPTSFSLRLYINKRPPVFGEYLRID